MILEYLGGIETLPFPHHASLYHTFRILEYLGGIETLTKLKNIYQYYQDFRIPRRDWNLSQGRYPHIEEADFRIPRRDWNRTLLLLPYQSMSMILEYLGGIETNLRRTSNKTFHSMILEYLGGIETLYAFLFEDLAYSRF